MSNDLRSREEFSSPASTPRTVKSIDGVGWTAMHLLCKVHCRMQCKAATFAMQREREKESKREGGGSRRSPSRPLPESWAPSPSHIEKCSKERIDLDHEAEKFRNHALAKDMRYANWDRAFTNWLSRDWVKRTSAGLDPLKDW